MNAEAVVAELAQKARKASRSLSTATGAERKGALEAIAKAIEYASTDARSPSS